MRSRRLRPTSAAGLVAFPSLPLASLALASLPLVVRGIVGNRVSVSFGGPNATCDDAPTGRRFHARRATVSDCPSGTGWAMKGILDGDAGRYVSILSCPIDEILKVELIEGGGSSALTADERDFFSTLASEIASGSPDDLNDAASQGFQAINAARLLASWPDGDPVRYELDAAAQRALQASRGDPDPRFRSPVPEGGPPPPDGPIPAHVHPGGRLRTSLCPDLTRYLNGGQLDQSISARLDDAGTCGDGLELWKLDGTGRLCSEGGNLPAGYEGGWAAGNCFGRCGMGCGGSAEGGDGTSMAQYTLDCAELHFCVWFGFGRNATAAGCAAQFLDAADDWMWSGNCDLEAKEEISPGESCEEEAASVDVLLAEGRAAGGGGGPGAGEGDDPDLLVAQGDAAGGGHGPGAGEGDDPDLLVAQGDAAGGGHGPGAGEGDDPDLLVAQGDAAGGGHGPGAGEGGGPDPRKAFRRSLAKLKPELTELLHREVRSITGHGNNVAHPDWGAAGMPLLRRTSAAYGGDGTGIQMAGAGRPGPREVSNRLMRSGTDVGPVKAKNSKGLSDMLWQWGQFLDHDLVHSAMNPDEPKNIAVPLGDDMLDPHHTGNQMIPFDRTMHVMDDQGVRQQMNGLTAYIDASAVYGSDSDREIVLRAHQGGLMQMSEGGFPPYNTEGFPNEHASRDHFLAGDIRSNEQIGLTAMHALFLREHNHCARAIDEIFREDGTLLTDEELYQLCRRIVGAEMQSITYNEFLPGMLGNGGVPRYRGYDETVDAGIFNEFSILYRVGHIMLSDRIQLMGPEKEPMDHGPMMLRHVFFNNSAFLHAEMEPILRGLAAQHCHEIEPMIVEDVRSFLFGGGREGLDLAALNLQRERDHGLPSYNDFREAHGMGPAATFGDITSDGVMASKLEELYGTVDDVDLFVGCVAEDHHKGAMVGETMYHVIREQFDNLMHGDRMFYENDLPHRLVQFIEGKCKLSDIIIRNTEIKEGEIPIWAMKNAYM